MKQLAFFFTVLVVLVSGCTKQSQSDMALEFSKTGQYELLSDDDKAIYTKSEFESFWKTDSAVSLEPSSKYFNLEKYLKNLINYKIKTTTKNEVLVTSFYPEVLLEIYFDNLELLNDKDSEKLENLYLAHQKKLLDVSDFKFEEFELTYKFVNSGISLDLAQVKIRRDKEQKIDALNESVKSITDKGIDLYMLALNHGDIDKFNSLLKSAESLEENIKECKNIKNKILILNPEGSTYRIDYYIESGEKILGIRKQFHALKDHIVFKELEISKANNGDLAIFGNFEYKGKEKIKNSHFIAKFLDSTGNIIATQNLNYFANDLFTGKIKSFGLKIKDQFVAKSAKAVVLEPIAVF
jgi:hypothetical protein